MARAPVEAACHSATVHNEPGLNFHLAPMTPSALPERLYLSGFGNQFASEALPGALPQGRNSPQHGPHGLYTELLSGSAFTAPRAENRRSWLYRRLPSVLTGPCHPYEQPHWTSGAAGGVSTPPNPLRWNPFPLPKAPTDFIDGLHTLAAAGDVTLIDVKRMRFSLPGLLLDARRKLRRKLRRAGAAPASAGSS